MVIRIATNVELDAVQRGDLCIGHGGKWLLVAVLYFQQALNSSGPCGTYTYEQHEQR